MALPLPNPDYKNNFRLCAPHDPAINISKSNLVEYAKTCEEKHLVFHDGQTPTWFHLRWLGQADFARLLDTTQSNTQKLHLAFIYCVSKIENAPGNNNIMIPGTTIPGLGLNIFESKEIEQLFDFNTIMWVGGVAHDRHFLAAGIKPTYQVPHVLAQFIHMKTRSVEDTSPSVDPTAQ